MPGDDANILDKDGDTRMQLPLVDMSRAYFNACIDPDSPVCVELRREHPGRGTCIWVVVKTCMVHGARLTGGNRNIQRLCLRCVLLTALPALVPSRTLNVVCSVESTATTLLRLDHAESFIGMHDKLENDISLPRADGWVQATTT